MIEELKKLGLNAKEGLERVLGDEELYEMMLGMFLDSVQDNPVSPKDFMGEEQEELIKRVHTLKGVAGNLAITPLFKGYTRTLEFLRAGQPKQAQEEYERISLLQEEILACIRRHTGV
jgi:HPt (histidine-containing phosphotransfer) domain-containing protein